MNSIKLHQAAVCSSFSNIAAENSMPSRSADVTGDVADALCQWSARRTDLAFGQRESINCFRPNESTLAISRSTQGTRIAKDGGRQVVSQFALCDAELAGYEGNVVDLINVLQSMGKLLLQLDSSEVLPEIVVPDRSFFANDRVTASRSDQAIRVLEAIDIHERVMIVGLEEPLDFLRDFFNVIPVDRRTSISFATGLTVNDERPYQIQFFPKADAVLLQQFNDRQLRTISFS